MSFSTTASAHTASTVQIAFRYLLAGLFILAVGSIAFAAFGVFDAIHQAGNGPISKTAIEHRFAIHIAVGSVTVLVMLLLPIIAWRGHLGSAMLKWSEMLAALGLIRAALGTAVSVPALGLFHGLLAAAIVAITGALTHRTWTQRQPAATQAPPTSDTASNDTA